MGLSVVTAATVFPVSLAEAKAHCRVDHGADDALINGLIATANDYVEKYCDRAFAAQTLAQYRGEFEDEMILARGPVQSVTHVKYLDAAGAEQTLSTDIYSADLISDPQRIVLKDGQSWPETDEAVNAVWITYVTGVCPAPVKQAMLLLIGLWYDARAAAVERPMSEFPHAVDALLVNYRAYT